jgi:hypothetical protein
MFSPQGNGLVRLFKQNPDQAKKYCPHLKINGNMGADAIMLAMFNRLGAGAVVKEVLPGSYTLPHIRMCATAHHRGTVETNRATRTGQNWSESSVSATESTASLHLFSVQFYCWRARPKTRTVVLLSYPPDAHAHSRR